MQVNVNLFSEMREGTKAEKLNKIRTAAFLVNKQFDLLFYLQNGFKQDTVKWLCENGVVKYNKPSDVFFVDWDSYHKAKSNKSNHSLNWSFGQALCC